ncbi:hypothetical protein ACQI4F_18190 [Mycolicibacterium vaccae]|uniref:hypothetical protein n=1 Tax=Mycolicibacterium vaccae TaxID=1810 RepID=UPI003CEE03A3
MEFTDEDIEEMHRHLAAKYGSEFDLLALAAIGMAYIAWRRGGRGDVEEAHAGRRSRISDGEMFAANVANTRFLLERLKVRPATDADWYSLADAFTDPHRVAGRRALVDLLGKSRHRRWMSGAWGYIVSVGRTAQEFGFDQALLAPAFIGSHQERWWAGPKWPEVVDAFISQLSDEPPGTTKQHLQLGLLDGPDQIDPQILDWCATTQLIGYTRLPSDETEGRN